MPRFLMAFLGGAVVVVATVWLYNRFLAPKGKTIADLGQKPAAAA